MAENGETKEQSDELYVLDTTHPGAQEYLRQTYSTLVKDWGIRYIKLDFMEDSAVEGFYHRPNTTALEAQRTGLQIIRETVGEDVLLDKDGGPMLNPVGIVDFGRTSVDTGHTFAASKEAAPGIAARYYMNRNFYVSDPDAFTVSRQFLQEQKWHGGGAPLTVDEAKVSIALAAVSGGIFEVGDDLPTLFLDTDRMALVQDRDLLMMARYGHAARPLDLMTYSSEDTMPSTFLLRESGRQAILTVFNWTDKRRQHRFLLSDLGLHLAGHVQIFDVFESNKAISENHGSIAMDMAPHSVQMIKIIDTSVSATAPVVRAHVRSTTEVGKATDFSAQADPERTPALAYRWEFGDGTSAESASVAHTYTHAGSFAVHLTVDGIDGKAFNQTFAIAVGGEIEPRFTPGRNRRFAQ